MELQSLLILFGISAAASMDSFSAVLAYSAAGIHIPPRSVWTLGLVSGGLLGLSVLVGSRLGALGAVAQITGAVLLILLGARQAGGELAAEPGCPAGRTGPLYILGMGPAVYAVGLCRSHPGRRGPLR